MIIPERATVQPEPLEILATYSDAGNGDVELLGKRTALERLIFLLRSVSEPVVATLMGETLERPFPEERLLKRLVILPDSKAFDVRVDGETLILQGDLDSRSRVAQNIRMLVREDDLRFQSPHVHIEHYKGHPFIAPTAVPLIVARYPRE